MSVSFGKLDAALVVASVALIAGLSCRGPSPTPIQTPEAEATLPPTSTSLSTPITSASPTTPESPVPTATAPLQQASSTPTPSLTAAPLPTATPLATPTPTPVPGTSESITLVMPGEPPNLNVMDRATKESQLFTDSLGDRLMLLDFTTRQLEPWLAEGWELLSPDRWRFFLREGVVFHNGEPFDAEAAAWAIDWQADPQNTSNAGRYFSNTSTSVVDSVTIDVTCSAACQIQVDPIIRTAVRLK